MAGVFPGKHFSRSEMRRKQPFNHQKGRQNTAQQTSKQSKSFEEEVYEGSDLAFGGSHELLQHRASDKIPNFTLLSLS